MTKQSLISLTDMVIKFSERTFIDKKTGVVWIISADRLILQ